MSMFTKCVSVVIYGGEFLPINLQDTSRGFLLMSRDKQNTYLQLQKTYEHQTRQGADLLWETPALNTTWIFDHTINMILSQDLWLLNFAGCWIQGGGSARKCLSCHRLLFSFNKPILNILKRSFFKFGKKPFIKFYVFLSNPSWSVRSMLANLVSTYKIIWLELGW